MDAIAKNVERIEIITKERMMDELHKIMCSKTPSIGFLLLEKTGLLHRILPELTDLKGIDEQRRTKAQGQFLPYLRSS